MLYERSLNVCCVEKLIVARGSNFPSSKMLFWLINSLIFEADIYSYSNNINIFSLSFEFKGILLRNLLYVFMVNVLQRIVDWLIV